MEHAYLKIYKKINMRCIYIVRSLYFKIFSDSFLITFLSPGIATSINMHVLFSLSRIIMSGLLLGIVLSVCTCWFHSIIIIIIITQFYVTSREPPSLLLHWNACMCQNYCNLDYGIL